ncbi:TolC family protein [Bengtsoniella intestinalis]|uniref:TolC family protein n=1 Tax=Bengtsoniella intestinalis TaxID=3073143 RepID=UPI00391FB2C9
MNVYKWKRYLCALLTVTFVLTLSPIEAQAANKTLTSAQAVVLAVRNSSDISKRNNEIILKQLQYSDTVASAQAVAKSIRSFRWTPLLSFSFPSQLDMGETYDLQIQPIILQVELNTLKYSLNEVTRTVENEAQYLFLECYVAQETIAFTQERLTSAEADYLRDSARLLIGEGTQEDVDYMEDRVDTLTTELTDLWRSYELSKSSLSDMIGVDVSTGYTFRNPMLTADIPRTQLDNLVNYTLTYDLSYYEARMTTSTALINLEGYETLMKNYYGGAMGTIQTYINMAKNGQDIDYAAFMLAYRSFLTQIDSYWSGTRRILFFKFNLEWFKGDLSGSRYIEDEMYAVYNACMEYSNALQNEAMVKESVETQVRTSYESIGSASRAYESLTESVAEYKEDLERVTALNKLGQATYDEVEVALTLYQDTQLLQVEALATYNELLYDYDLLTCGAVSKYFSGESLSLDGDGSGESVTILDVTSDPYYYITNTVLDLMFHVGVVIPDGLDPTVTYFEVWCEDYQIGSRVSVDEVVSHLATDYGGTNLLTLRFYDGDTYVGECEIDASVAYGALDFGTVEVAAEVLPLGSYAGSTQNYGMVSTSTLSITTAVSTSNAMGDATSYMVFYQGQAVGSDTAIAIADNLSYLSVLLVSLDDATIVFYDSSGTPVEKGYFDTATASIWPVE